MTQLEIEGVTKRFGEMEVLRSVSLRARSGEFVSLLGPSGCGKSTLLRIVAGLEQPDAGSIRLGGRELRGVAASERDVAMVFQSFALYPQMTARENIALPLRVRRLTRLQRFAGRLGLSPAARRIGAEIDRQVEALARTLEIGPLLGRRPGSLSGGQRQRVALGRALIRQSSLLLMDEPLSNLDARLRLQTRDEIAQIQRQFGVTTLFVTHDQAEAMAVSDRIAVMLKGEIAQFGTPQEIYRTPSSLAVAEFVGATRLNRFEAVAWPDGALALGGLPLGLAAPALAGQRVTLAWRPEGLSLAASGLPVTVRRLEDHGADAFLHAEYEGRPVAARLRSGHGLAVGDTAWLRPAPEALMLFDAAGMSHPCRPLAAYVHA
ncbi:ABC transporter ATP-binding protein [Siccirubricoccus phaeus]|uniref:ABC transporter ATP-binding protein n=1 Tax=Siccirubricoccus phaeus TaxID=2595053 RepID=UPI00165A9B4D|nr:ABC transporter ATP-binding protein [Siccirubricoccus phaeus]